MQNNLPRFSSTNGIRLSPEGKKIKSYENKKILIRSERYYRSYLSRHNVAKN
jgi:hypothetical protein